MMKPTVHLNGTSRSELQRQYADALTAIQGARGALHGAGPNARDYYVQSPEAFHVAADEHLIRDQKLRSIQDELTEIYESLFN